MEDLYNPLKTSTEASILSTKEELGSLRELINFYLEINEKIESYQKQLDELQAKKVEMEEKIGNTPGFDKVQAMFTSIYNSRISKR